MVCKLNLDNFQLKDLAILKIIVRCNDLFLSSFYRILPKSLFLKFNIRTTHKNIVENSFYNIYKIIIFIA